MTADAALRRHAILCVLGSSAAFTVASALVKGFSHGVDTVEVMFFRSLFAAILVAPVAWKQAGRAALQTRHPWSHVVRTAFGCGGMYCAFYGFAHLPLAFNTALGFAMPLLLTLLAIPLLGERPGVKRFAVVLAGLFGVLVIVQPWNAGAMPALPVAVTLLGVVFWALTMITIRRMGEAGERNVTIVLWFCIGGTIGSALLAAPVWVTPTGWQLAGLIGVGLVSGVGQMLMTEGYRTGQASVVAPFEYGAIIYATLLGILIWGEFPDLATIAGVAIIVGAGLYLWRAPGA